MKKRKVRNQGRELRALATLRKVELLKENARRRKVERLKAKKLKLKRLKIIKAQKAKQRKAKLLKARRLKAKQLKAAQKLKAKQRKAKRLKAMLAKAMPGSSGAVNAYVTESQAEQLRVISFNSRISASFLLREKLLEYCNFKKAA